VRESPHRLRDVLGVDDAMLQAITDRAYNRFLDQLKDAETTNDAYTAAAEAMLSQAMGAFAKLVEANPAK
jgi:hypothetical protein